jgi:hypothetical protein
MLWLELPVYCLLQDLRLMTSIESVEKVHLALWTPFSGVFSPFPNKKSSIVDRIVKPLFLASHEEVCSEAFSTDSYENWNSHWGFLTLLWTSIIPQKYFNEGFLWWDCRILLLSEGNWVGDYLTQICLVADSKYPSLGFDYRSNTWKWASYDFDT